VIVYTDYFLDSVLRLIQTTRFTVELTVVGSREECLEAIETTPNIVGVLVIDHVVTEQTRKFYRSLLSKLEVIGFVSERCIVLSVLYRRKLTYGYIQENKTDYVTVYGLKYDILTEDNLKLDGLGPIFKDALGVIYRREPEHFKKSVQYLNNIKNNGLLEALLYMITEDPNPEMLDIYFVKYPELRNVYKLRKAPESFTEVSKIFENSIFSVFKDFLRNDVNEKIS
jgi:hypothetical protein